MRQFRYFTFEPRIDVDEAILVDFIWRAAELEWMSAVDRRAVAETGLELIGKADIPPDIDVGST